MKFLYYILEVWGYITLGVLWAFLRWSQYVEKELNFYEQERLRFFNHHHIRGIEIPENLRYEWKHYVEKEPRLKLVPPDVHKHYGEIGFDIILWPISIVWLILEQLYKLFMRRVMFQFNRVVANKKDRIKKDLQ
jgi:hypothetical protein